MRTQRVGPTNHCSDVPAAKRDAVQSSAGISDFVPYPANMTGRICSRSRAWNLDAAVVKSFALTERFRWKFRAEGSISFKPPQLLHSATNLDAANFAAQVNQCTFTDHVTALKAGWELTTLREV